MKVAVAMRNDVPRLCTIVDERAVDVPGSDLGGFLRAGDGERKALLAAVDSVEGTPVEETRFVARYVDGAKIVCHAVNYPAHAGEVGVGVSPYFFTKPATSVIGPGDEIESHVNMSSQFDFENELALVFGKKARDVPAERAYEFVLGYTIVNDVSHRSYQFSSDVPDLRKRYGMNWTQGKRLDASCVIGPWITLMIFKIPQLVAEITRGMTFLPGDVIATGTPSGTILDSGREWLQPGNVARCEIGRLGAFENVVGAA